MHRIQKTSQNIEAAWWQAGRLEIREDTPLGPHSHRNKFEVKVAVVVRESVVWN